jgi:phosphoglycolate phosphatase-like HAD superfamily hydrolase
MHTVCSSAHKKIAVVLCLLLFAFPDLRGQSDNADPLPSWNDGTNKAAIIDFVARVTKEGSPDFVKPEDRIATFDNDGTLWTEQPMYVELAFTFDRVKQLAPQHKEWQTQQPFAGVLHNDMKAVKETGERGIIALFLATHSGMTTGQFEKIVDDWIGHAQHPRFHRLYTQCVFQPMLELLAYLRNNGFKTYIVSGGEQEFMRPWTERVYGIPPEQVIGTMFKMQFTNVSGDPAIERLATVDSIDDGPGKPVNIQKFIGKRPIAAFGNSDGDLPMLEWATAGSGPHLGLLVHHTDAVREYSYDRQSSMGRLDKGLTEAAKADWILVDTAKDWKAMFPPTTTTPGQ